MERESTAETELQRAVHVVNAADQELQRARHPSMFTDVHLNAGDANSEQKKGKHESYQIPEWRQQKRKDGFF